MKPLEGLIGGSILLILLYIVIAIAALIFNVWLIISLIKLIRYAKWKIKNDYTYQHRKK